MASRNATDSCSAIPDEAFSVGLRAGVSKSHRGHDRAALRLPPQPFVDPLLFARGELYEFTVGQPDRQIQAREQGDANRASRVICSVGGVAPIDRECPTCLESQTPNRPRRPWCRRPHRRNVEVAVAVQPTNLDLLAWFDQTEREHCPACGKRAVVGVEDAPLFRVCLGCSAVWVQGKRIDERRRLARPA